MGIYEQSTELIISTLKRTIHHRNLKLRDLFNYFDQELKVLTLYYADKVKKNKGNKKLKQTYESFKKITPEVQIIVLTHWYVHKMSPNNLLNAIYYKACIDAKRGDRG